MSYQISPRFSQVPDTKLRLIDNCFNCGGSHAAVRDRCPAYGKLCRFCNKGNHFLKCCRSRNNRVQTRQSVNSIGRETAISEFSQPAPIDLQAAGEGVDVDVYALSDLVHKQLDPKVVCSLMAKLFIWKWIWVLAAM